MDFPQSILEAIKAVYAKYPGDLERQKQEAVKAVKRLPEYPDLVESLVAAAVHDLIYDCRHANNGAMKRASGWYGGPAKVVTGQSASVAEAVQIGYQYSIAGKALGDILGKDLRSIAATEGAQANGHALNQRLCLRLADLVPAEKLVRAAVTESRIREIARKLSRRAQKAVA